MTTLRDPDGLGEAMLSYREAGLELPPVPLPLLGEVRQHAEWRWGSEDADPADRAGFLARARDPGGAPLICFGHVGHGVTSWWHSYQLVTPTVALFARHAFGGAYGDRAAEAAGIAAAMAGLRDLILLAETARETGLLPEGQRLVVVLDEYAEHGWEIAGALPWQAADDPLGEVLAALAEGRLPGAAG